MFLLCFILSGIVYAFLPFNTVAEYFYCSLGALLFSLYIIFDTYMIVNRLSQEEYILGAIDLYVPRRPARALPTADVHAED